MAWIKRTLALIFVSAPLLAQAQTLALEALGKEIRLTNPAGFCTMSRQGAEGEVFDFTQKGIGPNVRLLHFAVPCAELKAFREGSRSVGVFTSTVQLQLLGAKGRFNVVKQSRAQFLGQFSDGKAMAQLDTEKMARDANARVNNQVVVGAPVLTQLGQDGNALYAASSTMGTVNGETFPFRSFMAMTLLNGLPLSVVSSVVSTDGGQLNLATARMKVMLDSLLTSN